MRNFFTSKLLPYLQVKWTRFPFNYDHKTQNSTQMTTLSNGLRVVTHQKPGPTATAGFFIDAGSRAETVENNGVAHFFEHMGSEKMSQYEMESIVENMGCRLFAYTSRENTAYYGRCFVSDAPKVLKILGDCIQRPLLSNAAINNERGVILREMEDIDTQVNEVIFDHLHGTAYQGTPLGFTILGPTQNINLISRTDLQNYIKRHYTAGRTIMVVVGDVDHEEYVNLAKKEFSDIPPTTQQDLVGWYQPARYLGSSVLMRNDDMPLAHVVIAYEGVPCTHPDYMSLLLGATYFGSWDQSCTNGKLMPTKLAQLLSEDDVARTFTSFYATYKDTALWGIYFTAESLQLEKVTPYFGYQLKLIQSKLSDGSVIQAKNALKTNYLLQTDGNSQLFDEIGRYFLFLQRQILNYGRPISIDEIHEEIEVYSYDIELCSAKTIENAFSNMISARCPVVAAMGPIEALPDYMDIRRMGNSYTA